MRNLYKRVLSIKANAAVAMAVLFCLTGLLHSQTWQWAKSAGSINNDAGRASCVDASGNLIVVGGYFGASINISTITLTNAGGGDIFVAKFSPTGNLIWAQNIGGSGLEGVGGVCTSTNGNIYVCGAYDSPTLTIGPYNLSQASSAGNNDMFMACYNTNGAVMWATKFGTTGNERAEGIAYSDALSSVFVTGYYTSATFTLGGVSLTNSSGSAVGDMFVARFNSTGSSATWAVSTGSANCNEYGLDIDLDASNNVYVGGTFSPITGGQGIIGTAVSSYGSQDVYVAKYNSSGTFQWVRTGGGTSSSNDYFLGLDVDATGNVHTTGYYFGTPMVISTTTLSNSGGFDVFVAKYNTSGTLQWANSINSPSSDNGNAVCVDGSGNVYVTGAFAGTMVTVGTTTLYNTVPGSSQDVFVAKYTSAGTPVWAASANGGGYETAYAISCDPIGNAYVSGAYSISNPVSFGTTTLSSTGNNDVFVAKIPCASAMIAGTSSVCAGNTITLTATGSTNYTWSTGATTSTVSVSPSVTTVYSVDATNGSCVAAAGSITVNVLPASLNPGSNLNLQCGQKQTITTSASPSATNVVWSPATNLSSTTVLSPTVTGGMPINYVVTATLSNGCVRTASITVITSAPAPDICMVTTDSIGKNNEIYWDKAMYPKLDSMIILRETSTNIYKRIGVVPKTALSMFVDTLRSIGPANGDPQISTYRYRLQMRDSCGNYSQQSLWHNTVYFTNSNGTFFWTNNYQIEGSPVPTNPVLNYSLVVFPNPTLTPTSYSVVGVTAGNQNSLADPNYSVYVSTADWRVEANLGYQCQPTNKPTPGSNEVMVKATKSRSNIQNNKTSGIKKNALEHSVRVYPNPAKEILFVTLDTYGVENYTAEIQNVIGQVISDTKLNGKTTVVNVAGIKPGVYLLNIKENAKTVTVKKIVIE